MTANQDRLRETLLELERELARTRVEDPELRALLERTRREIQQALDSGVAEGEEESLGERLGEAARRFEASHPALTSAAQRVVDALASLGI
jgi:hypothetical protein